MSSDRRPWYKWFPKDFVSDEKVKSLSPISELVYRRLLDTMWQSSACVLLNDCLRLANVAGSGLTQEQFEKAWSEIQTPGFELFKITEDERFIYSDRMNKQLQEIEIKTKSGKKGGKASAQAKAKQKPSKSQAKANDTDTDTDTDNNINNIPEEISKQRSRYPDQKLITDVFVALATTRKNGKIADSIILAQLQKWGRYPIANVEGGITKYLDRDCAGEGKKEEYLLGIIRNFKPNGSKPKGGQGEFSDKQYTGTPAEQITWLQEES